MKKILLIVILFVPLLSFAQKEKAAKFYFQGNDKLNEQKNDEAILLYNSAIESYPDFADAYVQRGYVYYLKKDYLKSRNDFEKAVNLNSPQYGFSLSALYVLTGEKEKGLAMLEKFQQSDFRVAASVLQEESEKDFALVKNDAKFNEIVKASYPREYLDLLESATEKLKSGDKEGAKVLFDKALVVNPKGHAVYLNWGHYYFAMEEYAKSAEQYSLAISAGSAPRSELAKYHYFRGNIYKKLKDYTKAAQDYSKAAELNPGVKEYFFERVMAIAATNKDEGKTEMLKYVELDPANDMCHFFLSEVEAGKENHVAAMKHINNAINANSKIATYYISRARLHHFSKDYTSSIADLNKAIELDANSGAAYYQRAISKGELYKDNGLTCEDLKKAKDLGYYDQNGYYESLCQ